MIRRIWTRFTIRQLHTIVLLELRIPIVSQYTVLYRMNRSKRDIPNTKIASACVSAMLISEISALNIYRSK